MLKVRSTCGAERVGIPDDLLGLKMIIYCIAIPRKLQGFVVEMVCLKSVSSSSKPKIRFVSGFDLQKQLRAEKRN